MKNGKAQCCEHVEVHEDLLKIVRETMPVEDDSPESRVNCVPSKENPAPPVNLQSFVLTRFAAVTFRCSVAGVALVISSALQPRSCDRPWSHPCMYHTRRPLEGD